MLQARMSEFVFRLISFGGMRRFYIRLRKCILYATFKLLSETWALVLFTRYRPVFSREIVAVWRVTKSL